MQGFHRSLFNANLPTVTIINTVATSRSETWNSCRARETGPWFHLASTAALRDEERKGGHKMFLPVLAILKVPCRTPLIAFRMSASFWTAAAVPLTATISRQLS